MTQYELKEVDSEDIGDLLVEVDASFDIKFSTNELAYITNFGQLCDHIISKIQLDDAEDCTRQQAFYKLRSAIASTLELGNSEISPDSLLADLLPRKGRLSNVKEIEKALGFKLNILRPPLWLIAIFFVELLASFVLLFLNWKVGILGFGVFIIAVRLARRAGTELSVKTVGEAVDKMIQENYLKSRRNSNTYNKKEVERVLTDWFIREFGLDRNKITREAKFG